LLVLDSGVEVFFVLNGPVAQVGVSLFGWQPEEPSQALKNATPKK